MDRGYEGCAYLCVRSGGRPCQYVMAGDVNLIKRCLQNFVPIKLRFYFFAIKKYLVGDILRFFKYPVSYHTSIHEF